MFSSMSYGYQDVARGERELADSINQFVERVARLVQGVVNTHMETPRIEYWGRPILFATVVIRVQAGDAQTGISLKIDAREMGKDGYLEFIFMSTVQEYAHFIYSNIENKAR